MEQEQIISNLQEKGEKEYFRNIILILIIIIVHIGIMFIK